LTFLEICGDGDVRLNIGEDYDYFYGDTMYDGAYYTDDIQENGLKRGRVEVCNGTTQSWGTVCDDYWTNSDAAVVCQQLGFSPYGTLSMKEVPPAK